MHNVKIESQLHRSIAGATARITSPTIQIREGDANFTAVEVELIGTIDIPVTVRYCEVLHTANL